MWSQHGKFWCAFLNTNPIINHSNIGVLLKKSDHILRPTYLYYLGLLYTKCRNTYGSRFLHFFQGSLQCVLLRHWTPKSLQGAPISNTNHCFHMIDATQCLVCLGMTPKLNFRSSPFCWLPCLRYMWMLFGSFFNVSNFHGLDLHNETCLALAILQWSISTNWFENRTYSDLVIVIESAYFLIS